MALEHAATKAPSTANARHSTAFAGSRSAHQSHLAAGLGAVRQSYARHQMNRSLVPYQAAHRNIQASRGVFRQLLGCAVTGRAQPLYSRRLAVCRPLRAFPLRACRPSCGYPLPNQQTVKRIADRLHLSSILPKLSSSAGSTNASNQGQLIGYSRQDGAA